MTLSIKYTYQKSSLTRFSLKTCNIHTLGRNLKTVVSFLSTSSSGDSELDINRMMFYDLDCVESTQDEARRILRDRNVPCSILSRPFKSSYFTVSAIEQTKGRGTSGRNWIGQRGNCFFTTAFPFDCVKVPITLLPLKIGSIVRQAIEQQLLSELKKMQPNTNNYQDPFLPRVTVKWPNDVLVDEKKICGILIETDSHGPSNLSWLLIGIGINVAEAPTVATQGVHRGRPSTCVKNCLLQYRNSVANEGNMVKLENQQQSPLIHPLKEEEDTYFIQMAKQFSKNISLQIYNWLLSQQQLSHMDETWKKQTIDSMLHEWENYADLGKPLILRDLEGNQEAIPVALELDGRLRVLVHGETRLLSSDYLL